ncbi:MAG: flagellar basal body P-ring protein FlgI [Bryobacteraceae bacterium]
MVKRIVSLVLMYCSLLGGATRLKDLVSLEGVRSNQLIGYGLLVGLSGTGDKRQTVFTAQSLTNLLQRMGVSVPPTAIQVKNTAAVMVTAVLPPFAQPGTQIDVNAAAIGDASSLQGGMLLMTGLKGPDGQVYAVAQGAVVTGGYSAGSGGNTQSVNHGNVGRVPNGAIVERAAPAPVIQNTLRLQLRTADFTTSARVASVLNQRFGDVAHADNSAVVSVVIPPRFQGLKTEFISELEKLSVEPDRMAKIVINERTGTIVMGSEVRISPVAIMHGNLNVEVQTVLNVSQPEAFSPGGKTAVTPQVTVGAKEEQARNVVLKEGTTAEELVRALNAIGSTPRDIISILQNLKTAGALDAELEVI